MKLLLHIFLLFVFAFAEAQNLVPNGGFEDLRECPDGLRQIYKTNHWESFGKGSPDLFANCEVDSALRVKKKYGYEAIAVPSNGQGFQESKNGKAYAGLILHEDRAAFEEFLRVKLTRKLLPKEQLNLTFFVALAEISGFVINGIGAAIVDSSVTASQVKNFEIQPLVKTDSLVSDTACWTEVKVEFEARGGEEFLILGGFNSANTRKVQINKERWYVGDYIVEPSTYAYYYFDKVSLISLSHPAPKTQPTVQSEIQPEIRPIPQLGEPTITVYFDFDKDALRKSEIQRLRDFFSVIELQSGTQIKLKGHTDIRGSETYNLNLSHRRNETVLKLLLEIGFGAKQVQIMPFGESQPTGASHPKNRRVELYLVSSQLDY